MGRFPGAGRGQGWRTEEPKRHQPDGSEIRRAGEIQNHVMSLWPWCRDVSFHDCFRLRLCGGVGWSITTFTAANDAKWHHCTDKK